MSLFVKLFLGAVGPHTQRGFRQQCATPRITQEQLLMQMVRTNQNSQYGLDHGFKDIHSFGHFQRDVPISNYEDIRPYVERAFQGEGSQLTVEDPVFYAMTSGTTGKPKYIPVTAENRSKKSQLMRVWLTKINSDHPRSFEDRVLTIVSPEDEEYSPTGIACGAESGHGYRNMPDSLKSTYSCPYEVYAVKNYDAKYYSLLRIAAGQSITLLYTANPSTVLLLAQRLGKHTEEIIRDVHDGTLSDEFPIAQDLRTEILAMIKPDPKRSRFLEEAAAKAGGALLPKYIWPRLATICCWKGGSVSEYLAKFNLYYPENTPVRDIGYFASEMRGSVPLSDESDSGVLAVPTNVFEFFPADADRKPGPLDLLSVDHLQQGKQYYVYVTTSGGLCRYDMNDIIEVTGFYEQTPLIRFVQKGKGVVSFTGEKLYESQVCQALGQVLAPLSDQTSFIASVGIIEKDTPRYVFLVEFKERPSQEQGEKIINDIDGTLSKINIEYEAKRKSNRIDPPVLRVVPWGSVEKYRKRQVEKGKNDGQFKFLKLTKDASFADEFEKVSDIVASV